MVVQTDASETRLGAALLQEGQPVAYASRALTDTETRYAQIKKEMLAVIFGLEHFHQNTYGRAVTVHTDHKPLEIIVTKPLHKAPKQLQRILLHLHNYDTNIFYKPGKTMYLADTLSRAYIPNKTQQAIASEIETINMVTQLHISEPRRMTSKYTQTTTPHFRC